MKYYVNAAGTVKGDGSSEKPFCTITEAAAIAKPGDEVLVYPGIYREAVDPVYGGREDARIVYRSVEPLKAVITGAEVIRGWKRYEQDTFMVRIPNQSFGQDNPYTTLVSGDWYLAAQAAHIGEVYLNDKALYEVNELEKVLRPERAAFAWEPEFSVYTWYTVQDEDKDETIIYANFHGLDPNEENVEINVRRSCFQPSKEGVGYITLSGFTVTKAATQWAPPTAWQEGMIGPHWSKGWIIEDCEISHSKCCGISLGKYKQPGNDNKWLKWKFKDGTQTERECICQAQREGWSKENIGSHIIRRCHIHDCGQAGIVGHLGGVFSVIEENHIHHINVRQNLTGAEIGGIKMHAAIDVIYRRNHIHHCTRGLWLDWQAQGTRVTQNLFHHNTLPIEDERISMETPGLGEDIFVEVSHGPTLIDHNILLSDRAVKLATQGAALVHNLIAGALTAVGTGTDNGAKTLSSPRYTPYHVPHRTEIAGFMTFLHGDMRFYNNIFVQQPMREGMKRIMEHFQENGGDGWDDGNLIAGTWMYEDYPLYEEWAREFEGYCGMGSPASDRYYMHLPVWAGGNVYLNGAMPWKKEKSCTVDDKSSITLALEEAEGKWILRSGLKQALPEKKAEVIDTDTLGTAFEPEQLFENPDGTPIVFDTDYFGQKREGGAVPGPFEKLTENMIVY